MSDLSDSSKCLNKMLLRIERSKAKVVLWKGSFRFEARKFGQKTPKTQIPEPEKFQTPSIILRDNYFLIISGVNFRHSFCADRSSTP